MTLSRHFIESIANLLRSKLRSFLAILGILVGTASVVALMTSSQLATEHALAQFKRLGTELIGINIADPPTHQNNHASHNFTLSDVSQLKKTSADIIEIAPFTSAYLPINIAGTPIYSQIVGATDALARIMKIELAAGRFVNLLDHYSFYGIIGADLNTQLQQAGIKNPIGKQIQIGAWIFTVIGVAKPWDANLLMYGDLNHGVIVPLETSYLLNNDTAIHDLIIRLAPHTNLDALQSELSLKLKLLFSDKNFNFRNPKQILDVIQKQRATFTWLLGAIGGISLLVGGIGVMNIMLVSVIERRKEIGLRLALGAQRKNILDMFLIEAIILTLFGGMLGALVGIFVADGLALISGWRIHLFLSPLLLGLAVSILVGIFSGFYPAVRAARLNPIQTLQGE